MEKTGAIDVYFEDRIEILAPRGGEFSVSAVREVLDASGIEYTSIEQSTTL